MLRGLTGWKYSDPTPDAKVRTLEQLARIRHDHGSSLEEQLATANAQLSIAQEDLIDVKKRHGDQVEGLCKEIEALQKLLVKTADDLLKPYRSRRPSAMALIMARRIKDFLFARDVAEVVKYETHED